MPLKHTTGLDSSYHDLSNPAPPRFPDMPHAAGLNFSVKTFPLPGGGTTLHLYFLEPSLPSCSPKVLAFPSSTLLRYFCLHLS